MNELLGLFGGGGGGAFGNKSAASSASPFAFDGAVNFGGSSSGGARTGDASASATPSDSRQLTGGLQAQPDGLYYGYDTGSLVAPPGGPNWILWAAIGGGALILGLLAFKFLRK